MYCPRFAPAPALAPTQIYLRLFLLSEDNDTTDGRHQHTVMAGAFHYIYYLPNTTVVVWWDRGSKCKFRRDGRGKWGGVQYTTQLDKTEENVEELNESWTNLNPRSLCSPHLQLRRILLSGVLPPLIFSGYCTAPTELPHPSL